MPAAAGASLVGIHSPSLHMPPMVHNTSPLLATALESLPSASALDVDLHHLSAYDACQLEMADCRVWTYCPPLKVASVWLVEDGTLQVD